MFFGYTRFSVFSPNSPGWHLSKGAQSEEQVRKYRDVLFASERMNERFEIFFRISMPIVAAMRRDIPYTHVVQYSSELPDTYRQRLYREAEKYDFIRLQQVNADGTADVSLDKIIITELHKRDTDIFALFNLDDDDLLSVDFLEHAREYLQEQHVGMVVSFGLGVSAYLNQDLVFTNVREVYFPKINIGMLRVGRLDRRNDTIALPLIGNHAFVDRQSPTILDSRKIAFFWVKHLNQDSSRSHAEAIAQRNNILNDLDRFPKFSDLGELRRMFPGARFIEPDEKPTILPLKDVPIGEKFTHVSFDKPLINDVEICYETVGEGVAQSNPRGMIVSFVVSGDEPAIQIPGLVRSNDHNVGLFKYLQSEPGRTAGTITISLPPGVALDGIKIRLWRETAGMRLSQIGYRRV